MITKAVTEYLDNPNIQINKKYEYIKRLKLSYADVFELMELYKWDYNINHMLSSFVSYSDSKLSNKLKKQKLKYKKAIKNKNMRFMRSESSYD